MDAVPLTKKAIRELLAPLYREIQGGKPSGEAMRSRAVDLAGLHIYCERDYQSPGRVGPVWTGRFCIRGLIGSHPQHTSGGFSLATAVDAIAKHQREPFKGYGEDATGKRYVLGGA